MKVKLLPPTGPLDRMRVTSPYGLREIEWKNRWIHQFHYGVDLRTWWEELEEFKQFDGVIRAPENMRIIRIHGGVGPGYAFVDAKGDSGVYYRFGHVGAIEDSTYIQAGQIFARHGKYGTDYLHLHLETHRADPLTSHELIPLRPQYGFDPMNLFDLPLCDADGNIIP